MLRRPPSAHEEEVIREYLCTSLTAKQICAKRSLPRTRFNALANAMLGEEKFREIELSRKPKQAPYKLGRSLEYAVASAFRKVGYWTIRAAQSRGEADIVAIRKGEVMLIQCKRGGSISSDEWNCLYLLALNLGANAIVADRRTGRGINYVLVTGLSGEHDSFIEYIPH